MILTLLLVALGAALIGLLIIIKNFDKKVRSLKK